MTEDMGRVDLSTASSTLWTSSYCTSASCLRSEKFRRFDFTGRVDRQDAFFGRPLTIIRIRSDPSKISETPQYPVFGLTFNSPAPGPILSWFIHELKTSAPTIARSARNQEPVRRRINVNILEESERMVKHFLHAGTRKSPGPASRPLFLLACRFA
jgi:hypothetical protein